MSQNIQILRPDENNATTPHQTAIQRLAQHFSLEMLPTEINKVSSLPHIYPGARIFVPRLPKSDFNAVVSAATKLRKMGFMPVPHLAARTIHTADHLDEMLRRLTQEADIKELLLIAGSQDRAEGVFENTLQLLKTGMLAKHGIARIGVAGHPEGHPQASADALHAALVEKNLYAAQTGAHLYLITQFFFDAAPVIAWERRIRNQGNLLPIEIGLHGATSIASLARHAGLCGVGASMKMLLRQSTNILQMASLRTPDKLLSDIALATITDPATLFRGVHFFPLGGLNKTIEWATSVSAGRFSLKNDGGLNIES